MCKQLQIMIPFKWEGQVLIWWIDRFIHLNVEYSLGLISDLFTSSILFSAAGLALKIFLLIDFFLCYLFVDSFEQFSPRPLIILGTTLSLKLSLEVVCHLDCLCSDVTVWSLFLSLHMYRGGCLCFPLLLCILFFQDCVFTGSGAHTFARLVYQ